MVSTGGPPERQPGEVPFEDLVEFFKVLSDRTRLRIVGLLAERPRYVQELAQALGVSAPTVSHHLFRLRAAGLVTAGRRDQHVYYRLESERLAHLSRALLPRQAAPAAEERDQVLRAFFPDGRLRRLPAARRKRLMVLEEVARRFAPDRAYSEREVDQVLKALYHDHCELRRALVDHGLMRRERGIYRRVSPGARAAGAAGSPGRPEP
ncbi:MAG: metalloregulator ArsR/SmtB family transcription factor [Armatimonadota bacterium]|nr:metalloregulator ArsR/SmtB family transcription factor [Armatimonadota bacterium]MDR7448905.1 metalloregulator ArsR/SmtB family transcription factor [Armatimonadota bacterium]MDR7460159.1 metalloregulator ArsR/SmtB family transcription factor [Armatimonadota bacterium]MDR7479215.1 metalloregulator ArsR/SmtB family transcription factor [Armatimonadota bacterium]MDR7487873.1 metalloregulator ArsR/SmtB family transcription factor [Armatimonadota bacterium]